ncbi:MULTISPECIES: gluconokinase [Micrococcales]|uniref:gluconokinase n=1 Tax=Micrococcales TaxID=85006 RepID=UPI000AD27DC3|nr:MULTISPECIES: gluconokinase [Micrococcales]
MSDAAPLVVVMGVSGTGKTTIGSLLATRLGAEFVDADSLHPTANIEKMAGGHPLTDADRWPWLSIVGRRLGEADAGGGRMVMACSALRRVYRDAILAEAPRTFFVHLAGTEETLSRRLEGRSDHFMPPALLRSQLETLEHLEGDEPGATVDVSGTVDHILDECVEAIGQWGR